MKCWTTALALLATAGGAASAQAPLAEEPPPPPPQAPAEPAPAPAPVRPTPPPRPELPPSAAPPAPASVPRRPTGLSFGIGVGYRMPTSLQTPNVTSVRIRLPSGLELEPRLALARSSKEIDTGPSDTVDSNEIGGGALARYPVVRRGRVDLELVGGFDADRVKSLPDDTEATLAVTAVSVVYGPAVAAWITPHWQVSLSALTPMVTYLRRNEDQGSGIRTVTTTRTYGLIFDPTVALMIHLYH